MLGSGGHPREAGSSAGTQHKGNPPPTPHRNRDRQLTQNTFKAPQPLNTHAARCDHVQRHEAPTLHCVHGSGGVDISVELAV